MKPPTLCPLCLAELPADYPYDHVAVDLALAGNRAAWRGMLPDERAETVRTGIRRGRTPAQLATVLPISAQHITVLAGDAWTGPTADQEQQVRDLWTQRCSDSAIAMRLGLSTGGVSKIRARLGLPGLYGPGGRPRRQVAA